MHVCQTTRIHWTFRTPADWWLESCNSSMLCLVEEQRSQTRTCAPCRPRLASEELTLSSDRRSFDAAASPNSSPILTLWLRTEGKQRDKIHLPLPPVCAAEEAAAAGSRRVGGRGIRGRRGQACPAKPPRQNWPSRDSPRAMAPPRLV